jgi:hypothetical protein
MSNETYLGDGLYASFDGFEVEITFTYTPGSPAQGPSYASGGQPADPAEVEFMSARPVAGELLLPEMQKPLDDWAADWLSDKGYDKACEEAAA